MDEKGNVALDGDGAFGEEASHVVSIVKVEDEGIDGVEELTSFRIYPNPVNDRLYIKAEVEIEEVVVYDIYGRQQVNKTTRQQDNEMTVDVSELNSGIYFVRIKTVDEVVTKRFIKQ